MIHEDSDTYYVTVHYPDYLENDPTFKSEITFRANIYQVWHTIGDGKILAESEFYSKAKAVQNDFANVIKRFLRS